MHLKGLGCGWINANLQAASDWAAELHAALGAQASEVRCNFVVQLIPGLPTSVCNRVECLQICQAMEDAKQQMVREPRMGAITQRANGGQGKAQLTKEQKRRRVIEKFTSKGPVYENCRMLSAHGELLCFCDLRKLQWYEVRALRHTLLFGSLGRWGVVDTLDKFARLNIQS